MFKNLPDLPNSDFKSFTAEPNKHDLLETVYDNQDFSCPSKEIILFNHKELNELVKDSSLLKESSENLLQPRIKITLLQKR